MWKPHRQGAGLPGGALVWTAFYGGTKCGPSFGDCVEGGGSYLRGNGESQKDFKQGRYLIWSVFEKGYFILVESIRWRGAQGGQLRGCYSSFSAKREDEWGFSVGSLTL